MQTKLNPYISFKDNARQAVEFYKTVFGGELTISTFKDLHSPVKPEEEDLVMHSELKVSDTMTLMCSDSPDHIEYKPGTNISISLSGDNNDELSGYFKKLSDGGTVTMPLEKAPWGDSFGMLIDKFGITWLVNISGAPAA